MPAGCMRTVAVAGLLALALGGAARAAPLVAAGPTDVDLELVLAVDVSRSMDYDEQELQRKGYVEAFRHPEVMQAIQSGALGKIAVTYLEWSGPAYQQVLVPWMIIANPQDADAFATKLAAAPITREMGTSISGGITYAAGLFGTSGARGERRAIDVSGDGPNNMGGPVVPSRDQIVASGVTINGLPIMLKQNSGGAFSGFNTFNIPNLDVYYEDCVIGGPGAFMLTVTEPEGFAAAIRRKLVLEIANSAPPARVVPIAAYQAAPRVDCMIGEKTRGRWMDFPDR